MSLFGGLLGAIGALILALVVAVKAGARAVRQRDTARADLETRKRIDEATADARTPDSARTALDQWLRSGSGR